MAVIAHPNIARYDAGGKLTTIDGEAKDSFHAKDVGQVRCIIQSSRSGSGNTTFTVHWLFIND